MLQGKAFLITGAGGALSRALIPAFHQAGARLFLSDPRPERMAERAQAVGAKTFVADLTRLEEALALARFVEEEAPSTGWSTPWAASPPGGFWTPTRGFTTGCWT